MRVRCARLTRRNDQDKKWAGATPFLPSAACREERAQCGHQEPQPSVPIIQPLPNPAAPPASGHSGRQHALQPFWTAPDRASITPRASLAALRPRAGAQVAQLVEHVTENHGVGGSIPPLGTILKSLDKIRFYEGRKRGRKRGRVATGSSPCGKRGHESPRLPHPTRVVPTPWPSPADERRTSETASRPSSATPPCTWTARSSPTTPRTGPTPESLSTGFLRAWRR